MATGWLCEGESKMSSKDFPPDSEIGSLTKDMFTLPGQNIRVSDALSNPSELSGCLILYCEDKRSNCLADARVAFYDRKLFALYACDAFVFFCYSVVYGCINCMFCNVHALEFGRPTPVMPRVFGLGWADLFTFVFLFCELVAAAVILGGLYAKFSVAKVSKK